MEYIPKQTTSTDHCVCPYCNVMFYYPVTATQSEEIVNCNACKQAIRITASVEFTCYTIKDQPEPTTPVVKINDNNDYGRQQYLAGHRDAYRNFARKIF